MLVEDISKTHVCGITVGRGGVVGGVLSVLVNIAVTSLAAVMITVHIPVEFVHAPVHPVKVEPD